MRKHLGKHLYWLIGLVVIGIVFGAVHFLSRAPEIPWEIAEYATMEATVTDQAGVDITSAFRLNLDYDIQVNAVRSALTVEPAIDLAFHPGRRGSEVLLVPAEPLQTNSIYRFTLATTQGPVSWAFQTKRDWQISAASPSHAATDVSVHTTIDLHLSQSLAIDLDVIADYLLIEPQTAGNFMQEGHILRFIPEQPLAANTVYWLEAYSGWPALYSDIYLSNDFAFAFETGSLDGEALEPLWQVSALSEISTLAEQPMFKAIFYQEALFLPVLADQDYYAADAEYEPEQHISPRIVAGSLYRYADAAAYADAWLTFFAATPLWSRAALYPADADTSGLELVGQHTWELSAERSAEFYWPDNLPEGGYLLQLSYQGQMRDIRFQVSNLTAYIIAAEGQSLIWAHDILTAEPLAAASVTYINNAESILTDADGLAIFDLERQWNVYDLTQNIFYKQDIFLIQAAERGLVVVDSGFVPAATDFATAR